MSRNFNFSAGPAALPEAVLRRARAELLDWNGHGASVMEMSHRGEAFQELARRSEADLRTLLDIPDDYAVLFLQGGASQQFSQIPMNLAAGGGSADYVLTGHWGRKAADQAGRVCQVRIAASSGEDGYLSIPPPATWQLDPDAAYLHLTPNETIHGVEFHQLPDIGPVPLVADMSSTLLSRPLDVRRHGLIYACAQKNIGPSGLVLVIVRRELLARSPDTLPDIFRYDRHAAQGSMLNTPPTWSWYLAACVFQWLLEQGGLAVMATLNQAKAGHLYAAIDGSGGFYRNRVEPAARSWMNVPFQLHDDRLDSVFLAEAAAESLIGLKGHRVVGGMRASLYNAVPMAAVQALTRFMAGFMRRHG
ncbi:MAG: 3-phosphoserine/phosphohydroxythreonine transaminase [Xanthomonadales bacterium]|nr:3-phosphoserine/phosphohydroxythreonine transaminase [Xanthomonadales bacterium]